MAVASVAWRNPATLPFISGENLERGFPGLHSCKRFFMREPQGKLGQLESGPIRIPIRPIARHLVQREACEALYFINGRNAPKARSNR